jgi:hypothetical protein
MDQHEPAGNSEESHAWFQKYAHLLCPHSIGTIRIANWYMVQLQCRSLVNGVGDTAYGLRPEERKARFGHWTKPLSSKALAGFEQTDI